jgi:hypothetical protein
MFAEVSQGKQSPADAAKRFDAEFKQIFQKWRNLKKI